MKQYKVVRWHGGPKGHGRDSDGTGTHLKPRSDAHYWKPGLNEVIYRPSIRFSLELLRLSYLERRLLKGKTLTKHQIRRLEKLVATIEHQSADQNQKMKERALSLLGHADEVVT